MEKIGLIILHLGILLLIGMTMYLIWVNKGVIVGLISTGFIMIVMGLAIWAIAD